MCIRDGYLCKIISGQLGTQFGKISRLGMDKIYNRQFLPLLNESERIVNVIVYNEAARFIKLFM